MNNLFTYLLELNLSLLILFAAYRVLFGKDRNFRVRRTYLLAAMVLPVIIPLVPVLSELSPVNVIPLSFNLEGVTVFGPAAVSGPAGTLSIWVILKSIYLLIAGLGLLKLLLQLTGILNAISHSEKTERYGIPFLSNNRLHASSFFGYIFADTSATDEGTLLHILEHEQTHKKEWHSVDRIFAELFVVINWFNPVAWMFRRSVIENHEFLADSAVLSKGTDPIKYQLSILNQYIGSASIANQFSNQIKNRINMLNRDYKLGSWWKLTFILPLIFIALIIVSCTENEGSATIQTENQQETTLNTPVPDIEGELFYVVEEMPSFNGGDPAVEFRKYIAQNLIYPKEAAENGVTGKIFIHFVVTDEGKVIVPDEETMARIEGKSLDEVVVVAFRSIDEETEMPEEKYINLLKEEVIRVVSSSPDWVPGKQRGKAVNVSFTFPVTFVLQ